MAAGTMTVKEKAWAAAKKRHRLSRDVVMMAKQLGLNPKKLGGLANHRQSPWKAPLLDYIRTLYEKRLGKRAT